MDIQSFIARLIIVFISFTTFCFAQDAATLEQLEQAKKAGESQRVDVSQYMQSGSKDIGRSAKTNNGGSYNLLPVAEDDLPPPFGANLFNGGFANKFECIS